ncbi:hypothetical protein PVAND_008095 [Polypedilum vanderplanki]|uniref:Uncharacterized protein n=1 Tax=Polypedilum vanderplanki TaxID=319348 RepID=A0A9J6C922_POLVA|nr:hypothetical protein PVAND_008095 [Polypedilum vanderplanki]
METGLKISNVQSVIKIKEEPASTQQSTIRIRALSQLQTIKQPDTKGNLSNRQIINASLKRLNTNKNVSIKPAKVSSSSSTLTQRIQRGSSLNHNKPLQVQSSSIASSQMQIPPYVETYIKSLEEQNKEMRKILLESRREVVQVQLKMHKLTNQINMVLAKCNTARPISLQKNIQQTQHSSTTSSQQNTSISNANVKRTTARIPIFPITKMSILEQFEIDLSKREISEYVFNKLFVLNDKSDIDRPTTLLSTVLESIIDPHLLSQLQWTPPDDESYRGNLEEIDVNYFSHLEKVKVFYAKLVNSLANKNFKRPIDKTSIDEFLRVQIEQYKEFLNPDPLLPHNGSRLEVAENNNMTEDDE